MTITELPKSVRHVELRSNRQNCHFSDTGDGILPKWLGEKTFSNGDSARKIGGNRPENGGNGRKIGGGHPEVGGNGKKNGGAPEILGGMPEKLGEVVRKLGGAAEKMGAAVHKLGAVVGKMGASPIKLSGKPRKLGKIADHLRNARLVKGFALKTNSFAKALARRVWLRGEIINQQS